MGIDKVETYSLGCLMGIVRFVVSIGNYDLLLEVDLQPVCFESFPNVGNCDSLIEVEVQPINPKSLF